ncbi:hypothetical protein ACP4OV_016883 [Aristida adscensionis]
MYDLNHKRKPSSQDQLCPGTSSPKQLGQASASLSAYGELLPASSICHTVKK